MRTLDQAVLAKSSVGTKLTLPWRSMNERVSLRTGELVVVGGAPGGGKSTVAVNMAMKMDYPTLYLAQDSPASVLSRMASLAIGQETGKTFRALTSNDRLIIAERLKDIRPTLIFERGAVTLEGIEERIDALEEWLGMAPPIVFIDNLIDMIIPGTTHGDNSFYTTALPQLKRLANRYNTAFICLHHVTRGGAAEHGKGRKGIGLNDLLYAGEREARHVWGVYNNGDNNLYLQVLKQQDGPADPSGNLQITLQWQPRLGSLMSAAL